jgi:hypothetical protein
MQEANTELPGGHDCLFHAHLLGDGLSMLLRGSA